MIEFQINKKKAYTHLSLVDQQQRKYIIQNNKKRLSYTRIATITSIPAFSLLSKIKQVSKLNNIIKAVGFISYVGLVNFIAHKVIQRYYKSEDMKLLMASVTPYWNQKHKVLSLDTLNYQLVDENNFQPSLLYHGISERQLKGFFPDGILTNPKINDSSSH